MLQVNLLDLVINFIKLDFSRDIQSTVSNNRANDAGSWLEGYIQDLILGDIPSTEENKNKVFSYLGSQNHPPDLILRDGPAIEIKKREGKSALKSGLQLNSSHPRDKLFIDDTKISSAVRECEKGWDEKDLFYAIGHIDKKKLFSLFVVQGSCIAASRETYAGIESPIKKVLKELGTDDTNELGKFNNVDLLGHTSLRVRGMWTLKNPFKIWEKSCVVGDEKKVGLNFLLEKSTFDLFQNTNKLCDIEGLHTEEIEVPSPNEPNKNINCIFLQYYKKEN